MRDVFFFRTVVNSFSAIMLLFLFRAFVTQCHVCVKDKLADVQFSRKTQTYDYDTVDAVNVNLHCCSTCPVKTDGS